MRAIVWIILVTASIIGGMFSFDIFIDPIPILLIFLLNWGALFVGFKGYLIKSIISDWETDIIAKLWANALRFGKSLGHTH